MDISKLNIILDFIDKDKKAINYKLLDKSFYSESDFHYHFEQIINDGHIEVLTNFSGGRIIVSLTEPGKDFKQNGGYKLSENEITHQILEYIDNIYNSEEKTNYTDKEISSALNINESLVRSCFKELINNEDVISGISKSGFVIIRTINTLDAFINEKYLSRENDKNIDFPVYIDNSKTHIENVTGSFNDNRDMSLGKSISNINKSGKNIWTRIWDHWWAFVIALIMVIIAWYLSQ